MTVRIQGIHYAAMPSGWGPALPPPRLIIIHKTDNTANAAQEAAYAHNRDRDGATSAHFYTDDTEYLGSVPLDQQAWAARANGNHAGWQIEICGRSGTFNLASGSADSRAALLVGMLAGRGGIPITHLGTPALVRQQRGIVGHADITKAYPEDHGTHTDPGWTSAQWREFIARVVELVNKPTIQQGAEGDPTRLAQAQLNWRNADHALVLDGKFGPLTHAAVTLFQKTQKIAVDGVVGPVTWGKLLP
jgi:N-acetylmuramoyl-L-alanine amidase